MIWRSITEVVEGTIVQERSELYNQSIRQLLTDSRLLKSPAHALFFAIKGTQDGHDYISDLYTAGVRHFIIEQNISLSEFPDASFFLVKNSIDALQKIASAHRSSHKIQSIGITGSNGKTTVKEWLSVMLATQHQVIKTPKSYNSQIGVPLSVWNIGANHEIGVFEAGISKTGEMAKLQKIIQPDIGIFTSIGPAHDAGFKNLHEKILEKSKLFAHSRHIICCRDQESVFEQLSRQFPGRIIDWSLTSDDATIPIKQDGNHLTLNWHNQTRHFQIPFDFSVWTENCIHAIITSLLLETAPMNIQQSLDTLQPVKMRLSIKKGIGNSYVIDDTYNNDLQGLEVALNYLKQQNQRPNKTLILSELVDTGLAREQLDNQLTDLINIRNLDRVILIGTWQSQIVDKLKPSTELFESKEKLLASLPDFQDEMILIKGARNYHFEEIVKRLEAQSHQTRLEINFEAIIHNLNTYRSRLQGQVKVLAMVKAFGYGGGSSEIANLLQFHNIDYLGVAYTDEAMQLRRQGIKVPIMVMNPDLRRLDQMAQLAIEPEIFSLSSLDTLIDSRATPAIHIKIETGMNRLGFVASEWSELAERLKNNPQIKVAGIFTHLSSSDDPGADDFSKQQIGLFEKAYQQLSGVLGYQPLKHVLNSSGIVHYPEYHFDMVRLGIGLYGFDPTHQLDLRQTNRLITTISQIKPVSTGSFVGYSRKGKISKDATIAILPIGYADGFDRRFGNGNGRVVWKGQKLPTIGNICMDMTMVDTLGFPLEEGDEVEIFGEYQTIEELADQIGTIPYEILTSVSQRVVREYQSE
jgi:alanine racemase